LRISEIASLGEFVHRARAVAPAGLFRVSIDSLAWPFPYGKLYGKGARTGIGKRNEGVYDILYNLSMNGHMETQENIPEIA